MGQSRTRVTVVVTVVVLVIVGRGRTGVGPAFGAFSGGGAAVGVASTVDSGDVLAELDGDAEGAVKIGFFTSSQPHDRNGSAAAAPTATTRLTSMTY